MQVHSLGLEECEEEYFLIGIHTTLEDFKLAFLLNKKLGTKFYRSKKDLSFEEMKKQASFSLFNYLNLEYDFYWSLISNGSKKENQTVFNELQLAAEIKTYLIPEKKKVDFFIKIQGNITYSFVSEIVNKIKTIDQIITSYQIDKNTLKSKDFLIF